MKYTLFFLIAITLFGCDQNTPESKNTDNTDVKTTPLPDQTLHGKVSQHGLYRMVRSNGLVKNSQTTTGKAISNPVIQKIKTTDRIPLIKGALMQLQYRIWPLPQQPAYADLRRVLKHPQITLPNGTISTGSDFTIKRKISSNQVIAYTGYSLDEDYELVEGEWSFEIWYNNKKIIDQTFTTYTPTKEEIATFKPFLELGNGAVGQIKTVAKKNPKMNWSHVVVGGNATDGIASMNVTTEAK